MPGIAPKKRFGQNFLTDQSVLEKIIRCAGPLENKSILEIGGGSGNLTKHLLKAKPKKILVIEVDKDYINPLKKILKSNSVETKLISQNVLDTDVYSYFSEPPVVFGNLPYNISTKILSNLLAPKKGEGKWEILLLMFQLEVANRIVAMPNTKQYGRLSLFSQFYSTPSLQFQISKTSFFPVPKVESALVKFQRINKNIEEYNSILFQEIIRKSFQSRRKLIKNALKKSYEDITAIMDMCNIPDDSRPENVSLQQFCNLTEAIEKHRP